MFKYLICLLLIFLFSCNDKNLKENETIELDNRFINSVQFDNEQADTLLAMYVSELEDSFTVDQVLLYTVVEVDSVKFFYAKVKVYDSSTSTYHEEETVIRFYDPSTHSSPYLTEFNNKGTKFTCNDGTVCPDCHFTTKSGFPNQIFCSCKEETENSDCSMTVEQNTDLWDVDRFNDGEDILDNIVVAQFLATSGSFPF